MKINFDNILCMAAYSLAITVTILVTIRAAQAEDCYIWPPNNINTTLAYTVENIRYNKRQKIKRQLAKAKNRSTNNLVYFIDRKAQSVKATYGTLGWEQTYAIGKDGDQDIAIKISMGWEPQDFGAWWEEFLQEEYIRDLHETKCRQRNWCRARYIQKKSKLNQCFQEINYWPKDRILYVGNGTEGSFGEMAIYAK